MKRAVLLGLGLCSLSACSSWLQGWRSQITGDDVAATSAASRAPASAPAPAVEVAPAVDTSKRKMDPFDQTGPVNEGSIWTAETQDNFYFSKNILHKVGDILIVKLEPEVNESLNLKIAAALGRSTVQQTVADEAGKAAGSAVAGEVSKSVGNSNIGQAVGAAVQERTVASIEDKPRYVDVDEISVRIAELLPRNSYRVEGTRRVFIRNVPYQLRFSGVIRDEDLGPSTQITSSKVIDSKMEMSK